MNSILPEADGLVSGDRLKEYGDAEGYMPGVVAAFEALTGVKMSTAQANLFMVLLKLGRNGSKYKRDNLVDAAGYLELMNRCYKAQEIPF